MTTYTNPFTGQTVSPAQVSYESLTISTNTTLQWPINGTSSSLTTANIIEVTATIGGLDLLLPVATQVSVGEAVIIRNIGSNSFTVTNNSGGTIINIASGIAEYIYLTDNTTSNGTWATITFGAGTSSANASALSGYGLYPITTTLNQQYVTTNYYANQTLDATNRAEFVVWSSGAGTITLPPSASVGNGWFVMIANDGTGILNIGLQGTDTIDGNTSKQLQISESFVVVCNGSGFNSFGYGQATQFAFTQLALVVSGGTLTETNAQASNLIQEFSGNLTSNQIIILPSTVQLYSVTNNTTGSFNLTFKTVAVGGATVTVPQSTSVILICDGTNVYNATSGAVSSITSLTLGNGSTAVPSLKFTGDLNTGIYLPSTGTLGFVIGNTEAGYLDSTGLHVFNGISGGTF